MARSHLCAASVLVLLSVAAFGPVYAQQTDPKVLEEIQNLKKGQEEIQKQLKELKQLVQSRGGGPRGPDIKGATIDIGGHPTKGNPSARLTLLEFSDYQCPFCGRHMRQTEPQIEKEYIESGKIRYVFIDKPIEKIHKQAFKAAEAVRCAGDQGKYWDMHALLFASQKQLEPWSGHAEALGLNVPEFDACMAADKHAAAIRSDLAIADKLGITGTPSFVLAVSDPDDPAKVEGLALIRGAKPFEDFKKEIDAALAGLEETE